jgi:methionine-S-sulfoxide reductase
LLKVDGVMDTVAGYTGNPSAKKAPSYKNVCFGREWVEGVRVTYDDKKLSYEDLLEEFFQSQKALLGSRQYASIIFPHDKEQNTIATEWIQANASPQRKDGWMPNWTSIEPQSQFYQAEGYYQRYWQKQRPRFLAIIGLLAVARGFSILLCRKPFKKWWKRVPMHLSWRLEFSLHWNEYWMLKLSNCNVYAIF